MHCPDCGHDNIDGVDVCDACGQPLVNVDYSSSELEQRITRETIKSLSPHQPLSVPPETIVTDAVAKLVAEGIGCLLIQEGNELLGIFTERDVLNRIADEPSRGSRPVREFMTTSPTTISLDDSIAYALHTMDLGGYRHLPVVDQSGTAMGIISIRDILGYLCTRSAEIAPNL